MDTFFFKILYIEVHHFEFNFSLACMKISMKYYVLIKTNFVELVNFLNCCLRLIIGSVIMVKQNDLIFFGIETKS